MLSDSEWQELITQAATLRPAARKATGYLKEPFGSFAAPPLLTDEDGGEFWTKHLLTDAVGDERQRASQARGMVNDHVIGTLARKLGVEAVPDVQLIEITPELIALESRLKNARPGVAHGSRNAENNCTNRLSLDHDGWCRLPINRSRFAMLAVLYGLALAQDHQVIYPISSEQPVYSVDHGHFFPRGPDWTIADLRAAPAAVLDQRVRAACDFSPHDLDAPLQKLRALTCGDIAASVAAPPDEWNFTMSERVAVACYFSKRRDDILASPI